MISISSAYYKKSVHEAQTLIRNAASKEVDADKGIVFTQEGVAIVPVQAQNEISVESNILTRDSIDDLFRDFISRINQIPMMAHNCNNCGGTLEMKADEHIFKCPYCGTVYAIGTEQVNG